MLLVLLLRLLLYSDTFRCYDFDESNELTVDEMTLSLKSTLAGLAKLTGQEAPDDLELEDIAQLVRLPLCCLPGPCCEHGAFRLCVLCRSSRLCV